MSIYLFQKYISIYKFDSFPTGSTSSFQNGPVEKAQHTIVTSTKALFFSATQDVTFWLYAFNHDIWIRNALPHQDQSAHDLSSCLQLKDGDLLWHTCISDIKDTVTFSAAKSFHDIKSSWRKLYGAYIHHININLVFSTKQATKKPRSLYDQLFQDNIQGNTLEQDLDFMNPASMYGYDVYGLDLHGADPESFRNFKRSIHAIVTNFWRGCQDSLSWF